MSSSCVFGLCQSATGGNFIFIWGLCDEELSKIIILLSCFIFSSKKNPSFLLISAIKRCSDTSSHCQNGTCLSLKSIFSIIITIFSHKRVEYVIHFKKVGQRTAVHSTTRAMRAGGGVGGGDCLLLTEGSLIG